MILGLYADDSHDQKMQHIISAGALIGWPPSLFEAERKWQERLRRDGIAYFRAVECENLIGQFDWHLRGWSLNVGSTIAKSVRNDLVQIIKTKDGIASFGVSMLIKDFHEAIAESSQAKKYWGTDPTVAVYKLLITTIVQLLEKDWPESRGYPIAFTFDDHAKWQEAEEAYRQLRNSDPLCAERIGCIGHADDKKHPPLQMADLMAYESRIRTLAWIDGSPILSPVFKELSANQAVYYIGLARKAELLKLHPIPSV
jgi:hypothetical protein